VAAARVRPLVAIALAAIPVALALVLFFDACGAIHGPPRCGALSYAAIPFVVLDLALESSLFSSPPNDRVVLAGLAVVAYAVALALCAALAWLGARRRRH
jgi:hypothetical protein